MGIYLDEPLAVMAAAAISLTSGVVGAWWQRRRSSRPQVQAPREIDTRTIDRRFDRLEQLVETTAVEVERIAEGQRFTTKLLAERAVPAALPAIAPARPAEHNTPH